MTGVRIFSSPAGQPRARRATDVLLLLVSLIGVSATAIAYPPSSLERSLEAFLGALPGWLDPAWGFAYGLLVLVAVLLVGSAALTGRYALALEALGAATLATVLVAVAARLVGGDWPDAGALVEAGRESPDYPGLRIAQAAAAIMSVSPYLIRPLQRTARWVLGLGFVGAVLVTPASPSGTFAGLLLAVAAAAAIRLVLGTSVGRPSLGHVADALAGLGVAAGRLEQAERQVAGVFLVRGLDPAGEELNVKVYGRDAYDSRLVAKAWRSLWYRDGGPALGLNRSQTAEHEAFLTLLAANAGVRSRSVVTAGTTVTDDAVLVLRGTARPLADLGAAEITDDVLADAWQMLACLQRANIAHLRVDPTTVAVVAGEVGLVDFGNATVAPTADQVTIDQAQLLATTAVVAGDERAVAAAMVALGSDGVVALLPYLQAAALSVELRRALKPAGVDIDALRAGLAAAVGVEDPELVRLRRVSWSTAIQVGLLLLAAWAVFNYFGGIDWETVADDLRGASWGWIVLGFVVAQLPRLTQSVSTLGSVPAQLPFGPVYAMQLATGYMNLAVPSGVARMAVSIRFFQRQGLSAPMAVASGAIDSFASLVVQVTLLALLILFSQATLSLDLDVPSGDADRLLWILAGLLVLCLLVLALARPLRRAIGGRVRTWWPEIKTTLGALRVSNKLALLFGGNLATELLFAIALGLFAEGLGTDLPITELLVINMSVSLLSSFLPVPGGIGVAEFGLTAGLVAAGMDEEAALAAVILYRIGTFYVPPVWGFFALRWLQRARYL